MASWRSSQSPKGRDHSGGSGGAGEGTSDSDLELQHMELGQTKRLKFLSRTRSRSSSPCSSSSPRTPGSYDSSPRAASSSSSSGESHWGFSSPKVFSLSKAVGRRFGFRRSSSSKEQNRSSRHAVASANNNENRDGGGRGESTEPGPSRIMLEKLPSDEEEREDYMTVVVGERSRRREKYVINKQLLDHHLFQTLMKCSEDMVGSPEFRSRALLFCDPTLFLHLVDVVGAELALDQA